MNPIEEAIQKAIEQGWRPNKANIKWTPGGVMANYYHQPTFLLMPSFWQSLGKALGWHDEAEGTPDGGYANLSWESEWHEFIDHLAEGKKAEDFFAELLK